jgi:esterase/lipase
MRLLKIIGITLLVLVIIYLLGPNPSTPIYNETLTSLPSTPAELEDYIAAKESLHKIKPGNHAEIIWKDSLHQKTKYAIVYLHGFSASREEGNPIHTNIAKKYGCNLYLSRLAEHGIDTTEPMLNMTADNLWESAKEAYNIGKKLGEKVILVGTSTGGSLALQLAATYPEINAVILLSPNIAINDPNAWLLNNPWGLQIARMVKGSKYNEAKNKTAIYKKYWDYQYRLEAAVQLEEYLETAMTKETFAAIKQPVLTLFYYKDEQHQDPVVEVSAMQEMMKELGTPSNVKKEQAIPNAENHVLGSYILSKDIPAVENAISSFMSEVVKLKRP